MSFFFDGERLTAIAQARAGGYCTATPFPHVVMDDFLPSAVLDEVLAEFPGPEDIVWGASYHDRNQLKLACEDENQMGPTTRHLIAQFNASTFTSFLERLTGIAGLIPDPHLKGGGLHQTRRGGFLKVHADFNRYERLGLDRRLNLILYLNKDWPDEYRGHLELWDRDLTACAQRIAPLFNRCAIFSTTDHAFHGHPDPLECPEGRFRRSLAFYYYTNGRPAGEGAPAHSTLFQDRPHETVDDAEVEKILRRRRLRASVERVIPPILLDGARILRDRLRRRS
jgi:hypothetical protein